MRCKSVLTALDLRNRFHPGRVTKESITVYGIRHVHEVFREMIVNGEIVEYMDDVLIFITSVGDLVPQCRLLFK